MDYGDPRCTYCRGRGYLRVWGRVTRCGCVTPSQQVADVVRRANQRTDRPYKSLGDMVQDYGKSQRGQVNG